MPPALRSLARVALLCALALAQPMLGEPMLVHADPGRTQRAPGVLAPVRERAARARRRTPEPADPRFHDEVTLQARQARGLYLGASFVRENGAEGVVSLVRGARLNAVVLDLKDGEGRVHHATSVEELQSARTGWLGDTRALVAHLEREGIYTIARIVCFADRNLPERAPDRAIQDIRPSRRGGPWVSWGTGGHWLDPYQAANHAMIVALAREAEALGFDEVQLDYVRFPVDDGVHLARYPGETQEPRPQVIMRLLSAIDEAIHIPLGVDVFGLTAFRNGDPSGLGQDLEAWRRHVEVYTPMLYINSMREWETERDDRAFHLILAGTHRLRERIGPEPVIRPFLQAFAQGAGTELSPQFIADQIRGARRGQCDGFLFWHPGHRYGMVRRAMHGPARGMAPFPHAEQAQRAAERAARETGRSTERGAARAEP